MKLVRNPKQLAYELWQRRRASWPFLLVVTCLVLVAWIPLYRILFPPLVDLPEHLLISKLVWEKLRGISHLDLQFSWFLGYRLLPLILLGGIAFCKVFGISLLLLPRMVALGLMAFHAIVVAGLLCFRPRNRSWWGWLLTACLALPAVTWMYSACWFIGFANYTLAITLLLSAIFLSERFLRSPNARYGALLFGNLVLVYAAHPFGPMFWVLWWGSRLLASFSTGTLRAEGKRIIVLLAIIVPIFLYHFAATRNTSLAPSNHALLTQSPVLSIHDWHQNRVLPLTDGTWLKADDRADPRTFARFALAFVAVATFVAFRGSNRRARNMMLSSIILIFGASWVNEKFIPVPGGAWLAYDYRFVSTTLTIALAMAGFVLISRIPLITTNWGRKLGFAILALVSVFASFAHLVDVRKAYLRNNRQARRYMAKVLRNEPDAGIHIPHSRWHPDGTLIRFYNCLQQPDCNPQGTTFYTGYVSELYPVKIRSRSRMLSEREQQAWRKRFPKGPLVGHWKLDEALRTEPCIDSSGNGNHGTAIGTTSVEGKFDRAKGFTGVGDYIQIPPINVRDNITVSAWVYSDRFYQNGFVIAKNPVNLQWSLFFEAGALKWRSVGVTNNVVCPAPVNNAWHHIAATQAGTKASLYLDGKLRASGTLEPIGNAPSEISIGRYDSPSFFYFTGRIDDVRIYDRALSEAEVAELYSAGNSSTAPDVVR